MAKTLEERLWDKVDFDGPWVGRLGRCWEWTASGTGDGYGRIRVNGHLLLPHRVTYVLEYGAIRKGVVIDHLCHNRACVRPSHLEAVNARMNTVRGVSFAPTNPQVKSARRAGFLI